jgi:CheY-like chemotaxis protein
MSELAKIKKEAKGFSVLYIEDNDSLRESATSLLKKIFKTVYSASDGKHGLKLFKKHLPDIVVTDIKMPHMNGILLSKYIKKINPFTKVIIVSALDDKEYLLKAIEYGVFRFLKKPVKLSKFITDLYDALIEIKHEYNVKLFYTHLKSVFNYQSSMVLMLNDTKPILANQIFLDFFDVENIEDFRLNYKDLGSEFMEHDGFLYNHDNVHWLKELIENENKLFHIKFKNSKNEIRHFILKYKAIPEKHDYKILSFDDVTELNLLKLFDKKQTDSDEEFEDKQAMYNLLELIQKNSAKIELHNYYKGLSITNDGIIFDLNDDGISIKTTYIQQKAIQFENRTLIVSEALPHAILCTDVSRMIFENQLVTFKEFKFVTRSPIFRKTIRVKTEGKETVSLFIGENKFTGDISIEDISLDAVKLKLNAFPAGLKEGSIVILDIVLELDNKPLIINTKAKLYRKSESRYSYSVVFLFEGLKKSNLVKYITKRQMAIIREFKKLANG